MWNRYVKGICVQAYAHQISGMPSLDESARERARLKRYAPRPTPCNREERRRLQP